MVNIDFIYRKISLIQEDLSRLSELSEFSFDEIAQDFLKQNTVERLLEKIIIRAIDTNEHLIAELAGKDTIAPKTYKETFLELTNLKVYPKKFAEEISKSVGTRNVLVHEYDEEIDYSMLYNSISDCLKDYHLYCDYILKFIKKL